MSKTNHMKYVALIPLRGGSKGIPKKNIKHIAGIPLCAWVLRAAREAKHISSVVVSTDSPEIAQVVQDLGLGIRIIARPEELATDEASTESVMKHFLELDDNFDVLVTIQATSPFVTSQDIDSAIIQFENQNLDSMLSAVRFKRFFWSDSNLPINYDPSKRPRRQDFKGILMENGAIYLTKRMILQRTECRLGGKIGIFVMDDNSAFEIDELEDWDRVERLLFQNSKNK